MDIINFFPSTKKNKEEIERNERHEIAKNEGDKIERDRVKIIQPLDIDKMEEFKNRTILFISQCKKKEYIYEYFQRMSSNVFFNKNNSRPFIPELGQIISKTIPKHEERELQILMNNLEYDHIRNKEILALTHSLIIIDTLYDFCKSVDAEFSNNVV
jgi:hypothetical protein